MLRFNKIYLRQSVTLSVLVVQTDQGDGKVDLTAAKIENAETKTLVQFADEMQAAVDTVRQRKDAALEKSKGTISKIPPLLINTFLKVLSLLMYTLNLDMRWAGMPHDPFGSATVTNIGSLGLEVAYVPLVPYTNVPIFVTPGAILDVPVVENGQVIPGKVMHLSASFDHRYIDGFHAGILAKTVKELLENPFEKLDPV